MLYDGSPGYPDLGALWALAEQTRITCMGVSAGFLASCEKAGVEPASDYDLSALRSIGSTGSPLAPEGFHWVYGHVGSDMWLFSTSGGTDVCTAFVGGCPLLPVYEGEMQCRGLGCAVEAWDEQGRSADRRGGGAGADRAVALDAAVPMGATLTASAIRESYFAMYPGIWRHGDWIRITPRGGAVIYGRSDATINRQGVRMGTSEIYRATAAVEEVVDALVVDIPAAAVPQRAERGAVDDPVRGAAHGLRLEPELEVQDQAAHPRGLLAAPRPRPGHADRRGATHTLRQGRWRCR